jgi:protease II
MKERQSFFFDLNKRAFFSDQVRFSYGGNSYKTKFSKDGKGFFYSTLEVSNNRALLKNQNVKYHRIGTSPDKIAGGNVSEFGTTKDSMECKYLFAMDAFHHVKEGIRYPAILCTGGMSDGRIPIWQPAKFAATLQHATSSGKPVLLNVYFNGGHFGESDKKGFMNDVNERAFALWQAGHPKFKIKD